ncbi:WGR domain-containing protein [Sulfitobacter sp. F26204]|uniref:WGR domain-containing protein n=1 Tax=Sulfitobacter sp. F26204 TaxID=2996014 RepID=UPI003A4C7925|nr:WGR domain-containing protein [Sulfitobacter sp. F26204]
METVSVSGARKGITLYNEDTSLNRDRFYRVCLSHGLLGGDVVERQWGRLGTWGRCRLDCYEDRTSALRAIHALIDAKLRRGYHLR